MLAARVAGAVLESHFKILMFQNFNFETGGASLSSVGGRKTNPSSAVWADAAPAPFQERIVIRGWSLEYECLSPSVIVLVKIL